MSDLHVNLCEFVSKSEMYNHQNFCMIMINLKKKAMIMIMIKIMINNHLLIIKTNVKLIQSSKYCI